LRSRPPDLRRLCHPVRPASPAAARLLGYCATRRHPPTRRPRAMRPSAPASSRRLWSTSPLPLGWTHPTTSCTATARRRTHRSPPSRLRWRMHRRRWS
jgi:hypothetical protein